MTKTPLTEENLALMSEAQREIVLTQWQRHQHESFEVDYDVSGCGDILKGFKVNKGVWDPFKASGRYHARYLFYNNHLFKNKTAIEIGCGTGLMGTVMAKYGADLVAMTDISPLAVENARQNIEKFGLEKIAFAEPSDLFEGINSDYEYDLITWMIPFFPGNVSYQDTIASSMIMSPGMLEKFLREAKKQLTKTGVVLVPSFDLGGKLTDPREVGPEYGYDVKTTWTHNSINGIQQGRIHMHELTHKK